MAVKVRGAKEKKARPMVEAWVTQSKAGDGATLHIKGANGKQYGIATLTNDGLKLHRDNCAACGIDVDTQGKVKLV